VHDHGGTMVIESTVGSGTTVKLSLPSAHAADYANLA
jgi:signal transduction histidine kinase